MVRTRSVSKGKYSDLLVLVQWYSMPLEDASWVSVSDFVQAFPHYDLEGKISALRGERFDTNAKPNPEVVGGDNTHRGGRNVESRRGEG